MARNRSAEVADAVGERPETLEERAAELRAIVGQPSERELAEAELRKVEAEIAARKTEEFTTVARARLLAIKKVDGSLASEEEDDDKRVEEARAALAEAITRRNDRHRERVTLRAEADALCDRFELPKPELRSLVPPDLRVGQVSVPAVVGHVRLIEADEQCPQGVRRRRVYAEVKGTEAYRIIEAAGGPKPWSDLTESQQRFLEQKAREEREWLKGPALNQASL
jgi:hypothetical protein